MIKNVIFDFDGTLADTSRLVVATMQKTIEGLNLPPRSADQIKSTIGIRLEEIPSYLWPEIPALGDRVAESYRKNFEILKEKFPIELFPGVIDTIKKLKEKGENMAIATSRSHKSVDELTEKFGIKKYFDLVVGGDDVNKGKPYPDSINKILEETGWRKDETMMVGDMTVDIIMGRNAEVKTCGVTYGNGNFQALKDAGADYIINNIGELMAII